MHYIPLIVENVCGAQKWVGRARWHFGSFYLWGDVPALMPNVLSRKSQHLPLCETPPGTGKTPWFFGNSKHEARHYGMKTFGHVNKRDGHSHTRHLTNQHESDAVKGFNGEASGRGNLGKNQLGRMAWSTSVARKAASAHIAKIPYPLAVWIARCFKSGWQGKNPEGESRGVLLPGASRREMAPCQPSPR